MKTINEYLSLAEFEAVIFENQKIEISDAVLRRVKEALIS
jgi:histidine ammonia-lyase